MMRRALRTLAVLCFLGSSLPADAQSPVFSVVTEDLPPFSYMQGDTVTGFCADAVTALLAEADLQTGIQFMPWARAYHTAQVRKNTAIFPIVRTPDREDLFQWIGTIGPFGSSLYRHADRTDLHIETLNDARSLSVGVYIEDVKHQYLRSQEFEQLHPVDQDILNIRKLAMHRLDLIAIDDAVLAHELKKLGIDPDQFVRVLPLAPLSGELYLAVHADSDPDLISRLKAGLQAIKEDGIHTDILKTYGLTPPTH